MTTAKEQARVSARFRYPVYDQYQTCEQRQADHDLAMVVLAQSRIEPRAGPQLQDHGRDGAGANGQETTSFPARSGGSVQARKASATVPKAKPLSP